MRTAKLIAAVVMTGLTCSAVQAETIRFWTTEEQPERIERQEELVRQFKEQSGHDVEIIPVTQSQLAERAVAAFAAGDLPDVIYHPLQQVFTWADAGILDIDAANDIVDELGVETFAPGVLRMSTFDDTIAAVPVDGWTQVLLYRKDLFEERGLATPDTFENIVAAIEELHSPPDMYGFVAATKIDETYMSEMLEHLMLANGVSPVDADGFKPLDEQRMTEVLEFYRVLADASPEGDLYWQQSRELYLAGRAAMVIWSPFILDELAGLRDAAPVTIDDDPTSRELAANTGVVTTLAGPSNPDGATWAETSYFGITTDANTDVAFDFVKFSMQDGYMETLAIAPEGRFPVRRGTPEEPDRFVNEWSGLDVGVDRRAPLGDIYDAETITAIVDGLQTATRWGVEEGQMTLAAKIRGSQEINRSVRAFIDGERDAASTIQSLNETLGAIE